MSIFDEAQQSFSKGIATQQGVFKEQFQEQVETLIREAAANSIGSVMIKVPEQFAITAFAKLIPESIDKRFKVNVDRVKNIATVYGWDGSKKTTTIQKPTKEVSVLKVFRTIVLGNKTKKFKVKYIELEKRPMGQALESWAQTISKMLVENKSLDDMAEVLKFWYIDEIERHIEAQYKISLKPNTGAKPNREVKYGTGTYDVQFPRREYKSSHLNFYKNIVVQKYTELGSMRPILVLFNNHKSFNLNAVMLSKFLKDSGVKVSKKKNED